MICCKIVVDVALLKKVITYKTFGDWCFLLKKKNVVIMSLSCCSFSISLP